MDAVSSLEDHEGQEGIGKRVRCGQQSRLPAPGAHGDIIIDVLRGVGRTVIVLLMLSAACSHRPGPITVDDNIVGVQNQTSREWRNVVVTVNDHFRGGTPTLAAGSRMAAPLSQFRTAFGQQFDVARQSVFKVEVTATDANGEPVKLQLDTTTKGKR